MGPAAMASGVTVRISADRERATMTDGEGPTENQPPPTAQSSLIAATIAFWRRVRERKIAQWGAGYIIAAFGLMQGVLLIAETFDWPAVAGRMAFAVFAAGFPIVLIIAWSHGDRGRQRVTRTETGLIAACVAVGGLLIVLAAQAPAPNSGLPPLAEGATVAVLPFTSLTNVEDDAAFAAGLHNDLLSRLAQVASMRVIGRTSVQSYRDTTLRINQIASQLDADIVLEGSVQRSGDRVRVTVQAVDGESEQQRWAETYDRELTAENLFDIQREITEAIAGALDVVLTRQEIAAAGAGGTRNLQAFEANARGRLLLQTPDYSDLESYRQARAAFDEAVLLDPNFAAAYAGKARALLSLYWFDAHDPALRELARAALDRAEALAPNGFETQEALAYYFYWGFLDYRQGTIHIDRALAASPNSAEAWRAKAYILRRDGHFNQAVDAFDRAMRLDPRNQLVRVDAVETAVPFGHFARAQNLLNAHDQTLPWVRWQTAVLRYYQGDVHGAWTAVRDSNDHAAIRFSIALATRDPANINFALAAWPVEARRPDAFPEAYEVARVEALLALGRPQEARALLLEVSARLNASANPYPTGWSSGASLTPAHVPGLLGDLAGVRAAERDSLNAPRDEWSKEFIYAELALAFLRAGDRDRAMHYLEQEASLFGPHRYLLTSVDPRFDSLRDHRRYRAYRARYEAWAARPR